MKPLTSSRNFSASDALPAATHWKEAFCPALTSSSPSLEKCGALSEETDGQGAQSWIKKRLLLPFSHSQCQSRRISVKSSCYIIRAVRRLGEQLVWTAIFAYVSSELSRTAIYGTYDEKKHRILLHHERNKVVRIPSIKIKHCYFM